MIGHLHGQKIKIISLFFSCTRWRKQREFAYRFGVNLVMYAMTGNYKADQVHIKSILMRLNNLENNNEGN